MRLPVPVVLVVMVLHEGHGADRLLGHKRPCTEAAEVEGLAFPAGVAELEAEWEIEERDVLREGTRGRDLGQVSVEILDRAREMLADAEQALARLRSDVSDPLARV